MEQLNRIELRGIVGNVRLQRFEENSVANLTMCTNYAYKDREGLAVIEETWHNVVVWKGRDMPDPEKITKGSRVHVVGRIRNRAFTGADGTERYICEVVASHLQILEDETLSIAM